MLNESVIKLLKNGMWDLATCAISVYDAQSLEGYQIKGNAEYVTEGTITIINRDYEKKSVNSNFYDN